MGSMKRLPSFIHGRMPRWSPVGNVREQPSTTEGPQDPVAPPVQLARPQAVDACTHNGV
jgi:hypothetical protein